MYKKTDEYIWLSIVKAIDSAPGIMDYRFEINQIPIWFLIRWQVTYMIFCTFNGDSFTGNKKKNYGVKKKRKKPYKAVKHWLYIVSLYYHNRLVCKGKRILIFKTNRQTLLGNTVHENVYDSFIKEYKKESLIKKSDKDIKKNMEYSAEILYEEGLLAKKKRKKINRLDENAGEKLLDRIWEIAGDYLKEDYKDELRGFIAKYEGEYRNREREINKILRLMPKLKLVVLSEASYSYCMDINYLFQSKGIPVLEIQHGNLNQHVAYNFGCGVDEYENIDLIMPKYLGIWGEYWGKCINTVSNILIVGNPDFYTKRQEYIAGNQSGKKKILLCAFADVKKTYSFLDEFIELQRDDIELYIRMHPLYNNDKSLYLQYVSNNNIYLDDSSDIYQALCGCEAVVSEGSTVNYEAIGLGIKAFNIAFEGYKSFDEGISIASMREVIGAIDKDYDIQYSAEAFFGPEIMDNYRKFVDSLICEM